MKYLHIHNVCIHTNLYKIFLYSRKDRHKDGVFLWDVEELTFLIIPVRAKSMNKYFSAVWS